MRNTYQLRTVISGILLDYPYCRFDGIPFKEAVINGYLKDDEVDEIINEASNCDEPADCIEYMDADYLINCTLSFNKSKSKDQRSDAQERIFAHLKNALLNSFMHVINAVWDDCVNERIASNFERNIDAEIKNQIEEEI